METRNTLLLEKTGRYDEDSHRLVQKKVAMSARSTSREAAGIKPAYPGDGWSSSDSEDGSSSSNGSGAVIFCVVPVVAGISFFRRNGRFFS